eukprot:2779744-Amphidinium_carterae.1
MLQELHDGERKVVRFTSLSLNRAASSLAHRDSNNLGISVLRSFGTLRKPSLENGAFSSGTGVSEYPMDFWVQDPSIPSAEDTVACPMVNTGGTKHGALRGRFHCPYTCTLRFAARELVHAVQPSPLIAARHSVALYSVCQPDALCDEDRGFLRLHGYCIDADGARVNVQHKQSPTTPSCSTRMLQAGRADVTNVDVTPWLPNLREMSLATAIAQTRAAMTTLMQANPTPDMLMRSPDGLSIRAPVQVQCPLSVVHAREPVTMTSPRRSMPTTLHRFFPRRMPDELAPLRQALAAATTHDYDNDPIVQSDESRHAAPPNMSDDPIVQSEEPECAPVLNRLMSNASTPDKTVSLWMTHTNELDSSLMQAPRIQRCRWKYRPIYSLAFG